MRRTLLILPLLALALAAWALASGADMRIAAWAAGWQREFQNGLAGALRALRSHEPGAFGLLLSLCFAYGFVHAVGPGHGKVLIGGYGLGRRVPLWRLSAVAVASSLGQAVTAVALVCVGMLVLGFTRTQLTGAVESVMAPVSTTAIAAIGLWLMLRGARRLLRSPEGGAGPAGHHPQHGHSCGHRHGPSLEEVGRAHGLRDMAVLIGSIAIRPCTGALLLLVLTWRMDILAAGIAGTFAMSAGTAAVTVAVAIASVFAREGTLFSLGGDPTGALRLLPLVELATGATIALLSFEMLRATL